MKFARVAVYAALPPQAVSPEPPEVIIVIAPVVVLAAGMIVIFLVVGFQASKICAVTPPIFTIVVSGNSPALSAVMSIWVDTFPAAGVNEVMVGGDTNVKALFKVVAEVAPPVVTLTLPVAVVMPEGTVAHKLVLEQCATDAEAVPLNTTELLAHVGENPVPVSVMTAPAPALLAANPVTVGAAACAGVVLEIKVKSEVASNPDASARNLDEDRMGKTLTW